MDIIFSLALVLALFPSVIGVILLGCSKSPSIRIPDDDD